MEQANSQESEKKSNSFFDTLMVHNTTIIAIILSIAAMIGNHFEQLEQNANEDVQQIENKRADNEDKLTVAANKVEEYTMEENADSTSEKFAALINDFSVQKDSLDKEEETLQKSEEKINATFEKVKEQSSRSNMASTIFEISILLSSIGMTNKKKLFTYVASALTVIGIIIILTILLL
ncbi:MAG: DUF4337 family protein [Ginsengibacter sp.]